MKVFLIYESDTLLSTHKRELVAVCDSLENVDRALSECPFCSPEQREQVLALRQSTCGNKTYHNNFMVREIELNK